MLSDSAVKRCLSKKQTKDLKKEEEDKLVKSIRFLSLLSRRIAVFLKENKIFNGFAY